MTQIPLPETTPAKSVAQTPEDKVAFKIAKHYLQIFDFIDINSNNFVELKEL